MSQPTVISARVEVTVCVCDTRLYGCANKRSRVTIDMNAYYFQPQTNAALHISRFRPDAWDHAGGFVWLDYHHAEVALDEEHWQAAVQSLTGVPIDDYHLADILNLHHPSAFDLTDDYDFLIFFFFFHFFHFFSFFFIIFVIFDFF